MESEFDIAVDAAEQRNRGRDMGWRIGGTLIGALIVGFWGYMASVGSGSAWPFVIALIGGALIGLGVAWLFVRARNRRQAHAVVAASWATRNRWDYRQRATVPLIDLGFLEQGDRRYAEDGAVGAIAGHPAELLNFTVERDTRDSDGHETTEKDEFFLIVLQRPWKGPRLEMVRRSITFGRGLRNAVRSSATGEQVVDLENDAFAKEFQVLLPDAWGKDVAFLMIPPDMQEQMADGALLPDVLQVDCDPDFLFLAWRGHFSAEDIPLLESRIADAGRLAVRWADDIPVSLRPV